MCTIKLKEAHQKIMLATAVRHEIKTWQSHKEFVAEKVTVFVPQTTALIDKKIAEYAELLALLEEK